MRAYYNYSKIDKAFFQNKAVTDKIKENIKQGINTTGCAIPKGQLGNQVPEGRIRPFKEPVHLCFYKA